MNFFHGEGPAAQSAPPCHKKSPLEECRKPTWLRHFLWGMVGPAGFEPTQWRSQSPLPYRLATAQQKKRPRSIITVRSLVGCLERFELSASRATIWRANQLRHRHHRMRPKGLEPLAHCLEGSCSIHLSYGRARVSSCCLGTCCENYNITWGALCQ